MNMHVIPSRSRPAQRGAVLLLSLIILVVLLGAAAALVRSFDTSLFIAGNLGFKRDLVNQGERVMPNILTAFNAGTLSTAAGRAATTAVGVNYSAVVLPTNAQGIPDTLLAANFDATWPGNNIAVAAQGVTIRYVIDRMCTAAGNELTLLSPPSRCATATDPPSFGNITSKLNPVEFAGGGGSSPIPQQIVYRVSVRVDGPRDTQAFLQTTLTR